ncbi:tetratricopeptide repeat protein [Herbidospora sp. RD11066]
MVSIRLLGPPIVELDGVVARPPRGRKAWALLAYLLLAERPPSRKRVAELLFGDADDPLGALRWTLAELRRALGLREAFAGDPVRTEFGPHVTVDVRVLLDQEGDPAPLLELGGELLEGVHLASSLEFESWLLVVRHRVSSMIEARLRQAAARLLAEGRPEEAVLYAAKAVERNPLEEGNHELLVRGLTMAGDRTAALKQVAVCEDLLRRELGVKTSPALREAATVGSDSPMLPPLSGRAAAISQLDAGRAAISAGAAAAGIHCLRTAVAEASRTRDQALKARAYCALGSALVHAVQGRDEEGSLALHEAIVLAAASGERSVAVTAHRELGFVEVKAGRRVAATTWLTKAAALAQTAAEKAAVRGVLGQNTSDQGDYPAAIGHLEESIELAAGCGDHKQHAWSLSILGRVHLMRDERSQATAALQRSLELTEEQRWMAFLPWPTALQAEIDLRRGDVDAAADGMERAWVLACQVEDPCWEGTAARGLGLLNRDRGDHVSAARWLGQAADSCVRLPDRYQWLHANVLDATITCALDTGDDDRARPLVAALGSLAARCDMREWVVRAHLHNARLGDRTALASARMLGAEIDNPALTALLR